MYYAPQPSFNPPRVKDCLSKQDIEEARARILEELLGDFPFTGESERAHAVALLLLPFVRLLIAGPTPLHLIDKPSPGTGAGLLADVLCYPALGGSPAIMTLGHSEDETRRTIVSKLAQSPAAILIDNTHVLDSAALSAALTCDVFEDRIVGTSHLGRYPVRCAWIATGNNPSLSTEIARRVVRIRMDAKEVDPILQTAQRPN